MTPKKNFRVAPNDLAETLDREVCYRALRTRDARFDGRFYTAVLSTGIYCRPICPARPPKIENCIFLPSAAAAHEMGFRPCLRCRPEIAPGVAGFRGSKNTVSRAIHLIAEGAWDEDGVEALASRVGVGARQLRRLFAKHVGATPISVVEAHRILFARKLVGETNLSMTEIALAAGFGSVRRFNDVFQKTFARAPSSMRRARVTESDAAEISLSLPFNAPYDHRAIIEFLAARAIPGVETVTGDTYARSFAIGAAHGTVTVSPLPGKDALIARIRTSDVKALSAIVTRLRRVFDLDCDAHAIDLLLAKDARLRKRVQARPGLRVPGAWDGFELAVRAVLGQQVSVRAATTFAGRIVEAFGATLDRANLSSAPKRIFPTALTLAESDLSGIGLTRARAETLRALSLVVAKDPQILEPKANVDATVAALTKLPGIGPWTAHYIAMRAHGEPDAFPAADLGLLRAVTKEGKAPPTPVALAKMAESWRPFRSYAAMRLWMQ